MERKIEVQQIANRNFNFFQAFLRPRQSGAHGTCHACHALDTPLPINKTTQEVSNQKMRV